MSTVKNGEDKFTMEQPKVGRNEVAKLKGGRKGFFCVQKILTTESR